MKQHSIRGSKYLLKTPGNAISETLNFKMSLDASAVKNLCLWCEFQRHLLFIISLLLENMLTALLVKRLLNINNTFSNDGYDTVTGGSEAGADLVLIQSFLSTCR